MIKLSVWKLQKNLKEATGTVAEDMDMEAIYILMDIGLILQKN